MQSSDWKPSGTTLRLTTTGTIVGMPAASIDASYPRDPIVPCDDPEDETSLSLASPWRFVRAPSKASLPLPRLPIRRVMPPEERRLLARAAVVATIAVALITSLVSLAS